MASDPTDASVETGQEIAHDNDPSPTSNPDQITFAPGRPGHSTTAGHDLFPSPHHRTSAPAAHRRPSLESKELMGPILRRKKVVSLPLGAGGDFFYTTIPEEGGHRALLNDFEAHHRERGLSYDPNRRHLRHKQKSNEGSGNVPAPSVPAPPSPGGSGHRRRQMTPQQHFMRGIIRRRQVSLDLLGPNDFFELPEDIQASVLVDEEAKEATESMPTMIDEEGEEPAASGSPPSEKQLFFPLRFSAPRQKLKVGGGAGHQHTGGAHGPTSQGAPIKQEVDSETQDALERYTRAHEQVQAEMMRLSKAIPEENSSQLSSLVTKMESMNSDHSALKRSLLKRKSTVSSSAMSNASGDFFSVTPLDESGVGSKMTEGYSEVDTEESDDDEEDSDVIRAGRSDKIKALVCFFIMLALTLLVSLWHTHLDEASFILGPVGLACVTSCPGNPTTRDFFDGHNHFKEHEVIDLVMHLDGNSVAKELETHALVEIIGVESGMVKASRQFGPPGEERHTLVHDVVVDFPHPDEAHVINVTSTDPNVELSFTLLADVKAPLADHSVVVAAVIMVLVYAFILLEVIHRTLIAIYGSMVALMFFFIMEGGHVESIRMIMLHLEWSTLGLLFGMMLIVGELSHTGVFEWCAVRILIFSKGSYVRLLVLLSVLTAVASAFLDNVTTMLLVAPVTIDMCHIVGNIDPRPYLIAEVLLSNIGGTATLIGDPPNIIIGSAFSEIIGFVDFITNVLPVIFVFCVPVALLLVVYLYRWYLTSSQMRVLDTALLKKTYKIYDEPRLLISGIVTFFVILMFFLHPVHHKDTAWIALLGAFVTIAFTNPHDIQSALRSHVEWDTLLFFAGLFVLVEVCAAMGLLQAIGDALASYISDQEEDQQLTVAITLLLWVSAFASSFLDNIPYTATMIPVIRILSAELPDTLPLETLAWALSLGACLGGNGTLLGASANIVTAGISTNKGYEISFVNFFYPGMLVMIVTVAISNLYMLVRYVWI